LGRVKKPKCQDCGTAHCAVVAVKGGGLLWLCGSCEMLRANPDAPRTKVPPGLPSTWKKKPKPQEDGLF